jgi:hypothetical protein
VDHPLPLRALGATAGVMPLMSEAAVAATAGDAVVAGMVSGAITGGSAGAVGTPSGSRVLVQVTVKVLGKGRCLEGTEIWGIDQAPQEGLRGRSEQEAAPVAAGQVGRTHYQQQDRQVCRRHGQGTGVYLGSLLGFVTTAVPRGAAGYPGGVGFCDVRGVFKLFGQGWQSGGAWHRSAVKVLLRNPSSDAFRGGQLFVSLRTQ